MSGPTGYCVVCGAFHAAGHMPCNGILIRTVGDDQYLDSFHANLLSAGHAPKTGL